MTDASYGAGLASLRGQDADQRKQIVNQQQQRALELQVINFFFCFEENEEIALQCAYDFFFLKKEVSYRKSL